MPAVVSNSTPLIYLAKVGRLELLKNLFGEILIPEEVKNEVIDKGKLLKKTDAYAIEKAVGEGWIKVLAADPLEMPIEIDKGEEEALCLAKQSNSEIVLVDDISARTAARLLGLTPRGTLFVLLLALKKGQIDYEQFLQVIDQLIDQGFRLREEVYIKAIKEANRLRMKK